MSRSLPSTRYPPDEVKIMDPIECVDAMTRRAQVSGMTNHEVGIPIRGIIIEVAIVGPDEVAAMVLTDAGGREECWPADLALVVSR